ncbi:MAG: 16S rRNA (uracil(1498)-N(3))-methyltransferase [Pseudomonadota bacterium]
MGNVPRLFVTSDIARDGYVALDEGQAKYLSRVMRLKKGDAVRVFNGRDGEWRSEIDMIEGRSVLVKARERLKDQAATMPLTLLFAPLKKTRTDFVVEKATEMGVARIIPVMTDYTQASRVREDRLEKIALEAAEQTERMDIPRVDRAQALFAAIADLEDHTTVLFCDEAGDDASRAWGGDSGRAAPMVDVLTRLGHGAGAIVVGPEGGFSPAEREHLRALPHVEPVTLGPRILRAETAVVAALALWQAIRGDWTGTLPDPAEDKTP